jgi:hypothetical protein
MSLPLVAAAAAKPALRAIPSPTAAMILTRL